MKVYLNDACPCGSGKKYKQCCFKKAASKQTMRFGGLSIDTEDNAKGFIVNRKGAVVFNDESKQPTLELAEGSTVKNVLSIGFNKLHAPMATIKEDGGPICYLLPTQYTYWCGTCIGVSMQGLNLFPCKVKFTKHGNEYFADIL